MTQLRDYAFIDHRRVTSYFQQVMSPDTLLRERKVPSWSVSVSLTGPKVGGAQSSAFREPTIHEKIADVEQYLAKAKLVATWQSADKHWWACGRSTFFVRGRLPGRRALVTPSGPIAAQGVPPLAIWIMDTITTPPERPDDPHSHEVRLQPFLIESCNEPDQDDVPGRSGYTALQFILFHLEQEAKKYSEALLGTEPLAEPDEVYRDVSDKRFQRFASDPSSYLSQLGAILGPKKDVDCLGPV